MPQRGNARIELKPAQRTALAALGEGRVDELTRGAYQELTGMSRSQAAYDLADLVGAGILERIGGGRSTRYRLGGDANGKRQWTSERIRTELTRFCDNRQTWPSAAEFKSSGRSDLYVAASRYGGIAYWAAELGFPRQAPPPRRPRRLIWALAGATAGAVVVGSAVAIVQQRQAPAKQPQLASAAPRAKPAKHRSRRAVRKSRPRTSPVASRKTAPRRAAPHVTTPPVQAREVAVRTVVRTVASTTRAPAEPAAAQSTSGPTPLPAPGGGSSSPAPLAAPG